jgi:IclR family transcriptional regulator, pca regulon regulatory protein
MPARTTSTNPDQEFIPSLIKGLAVLELFGAETPALTLSQISRALGLTPGSAHRVLLTLEHLGYLVCEDNRFSLKTRVMQLGFAYLSSQPLAKVARPVLTDLAVKLQSNCSVAVLDDTDVLYVARARYRYINRDFVSIGSRFPAHATSPGKVLLAALPDEELRKRYKDKTLEAFTPNTVSSLKALRTELTDVRSQGYAINDQQTFLGHRSVAIPLKLDEQVVAALVCASEVSLVRTNTLVSDYLPAMRAASDLLAKLTTVLV